MKVAGRIIMIVVGIGMIAMGIYFGYDAITATMGYRWDGISHLLSYIPIFLKALQCLAYIIFGVAAIISAIRGRAFFRFFIYSALVLCFTIYNLYLAKTGGGALESKTITTVVVGFVAPIMYIVGSFCLLFN